MGVGTLERLLLRYPVSVSRRRLRCLSREQGIFVSTYILSLFSPFIDKYTAYIPRILNADLTYLNLIAGGIVMMFILVPIQQWWYKRVRDDDKDVAPPRARFYLAGMTVAFIPVAMGMFSWASGPGSPKGAIFPIICGGIMGVFDPFLWLAMLIYVLGKSPPFLLNPFNRLELRN